LGKHDNTALIKLDGTLIKTDGTEEKSTLFSFLELEQDDYSDVAYTPVEAAKIRCHLQGLSTGASAAIPLICGGRAKCPFADRCPFLRVDAERRAIDPHAKLTTPISKQCLVEVNLLREWTRLFIDEYKIEEENFTEFMMVREMAEIELMMWRLNNNIAKPQHAELVQETVVGVDKQGNPLTRLEISAFMEAKERLQNRKSKLIKLMVGDRQEKYKREAALKVKSSDDPSTNAAKLKGQIGRLLLQAKSLDVKMKEAEGNVIDVKSETVVNPDPPPLSPEDLINGS
jgi:hypothetical protein